MFKKLFSKPETAKYLVIARLNDRAQPIDRGERYENPLDAFLKANGLGEVSGGGTQLLESGEIEFCEVELALATTARSASWLIRIVDTNAMCPHMKRPRNNPLAL